MYYIKGIGMTKFGIESHNTLDFAKESSVLALDDAGLSINDIDVIVVSNTDNRFSSERQRHFNSFLSSLFKKKYAHNKGSGCMWRRRGSFMDCIKIKL